MAEETKTTGAQAAESKDAVTKDEDSELEWVQNLKGLNKELEARILEANNDETKVKWSKLLPDLMVSDVLILADFGNAVDAAGNKLLNIMMMQKGNSIAVPFFTSPDKIAVFVKRGQTQFPVMKLNTVRFFQSIRGKTAVLNPMTAYSKVFSPFETRVLAAENESRVPPVELKK